MPFWTSFSHGLRALLRKDQSEQEMDDELRAFMEASVEAKVRAGMSQAEAQRAARVEVGSAEAVKQGIREAGWESNVEAVWADIRYSVRVLRKAPLFAAVVVLTLALGIGANTAIFSLINAIMLKNLPVENPQELVHVTDYYTNPIFEQVRDRQDVLSGVFAWSGDQFNLSRAGLAQNAQGLWVSGDYFRTLGLRPAAGRLLSMDDDRRGCAGLAVVSYSFWQSRYGGAGSAIGSKLSINSQPFEIIGVAPAGFNGLEVGRRFDVAAPLCATSLIDPRNDHLNGRSFWWLEIGGRLKPGVGMATLTARMKVLSPQIFGAVVPQNFDSESQERFRKRLLEAAPLGTGLSQLRKQYTEPLQILMGVVGLVLLIACANIASLLMARAAARSKEMAMRQALGASRSRLVRQLLTESTLLSVAGAAAGLLFARWGDLLLVRYLSTIGNTVFLDFSLDRRVLGFTIGVALLTGLLFGVAPAWRGTSGALNAAIKDVRGSGPAQRSRLRLWIVASQVALSLVLLVTAGLLLRSFQRLATLDTGFDRNQVLLVRVESDISKLAEKQRNITYDQIEDGLRSIPGVVSASHSMVTPMGHMMWNTSIQCDTPHPLQADDSLTNFNMVSPAYFETMRMRLLAGRGFNSGDTATSSEVAVVSETIAKKFFAGVNPIGRTYRAEGEARKLEAPVQVIGVVQDAKFEDLRETAPPMVFRPIAQMPAESFVTFEVRTAASAPAMVPSIGRAIAAVHPGLSLEVHSLAAQVEDAMSRERLLAALSAFFGGLALLLAMIGLYGTLSYLVAQRRVEFGIRLALGAPTNSILGLVMRDVLLLLTVGIAAGIGLSLATTGVLDKLLFGLKPRDPATLAIGASLLAAVSLGAGFLAGRRATQVDPMMALRND